MLNNKKIFRRGAKLHAIQDDKNKILNLPKLPGRPILTTMITKNNAKIHLVGVEHFTKKSREHVSNIIRQMQPNIVVVELCEATKLLMGNSNSEMGTALKEAQKIPGCQLLLKNNRLRMSLKFKPKLSPGWQILYFICNR